MADEFSKTKAPVAVLEYEPSAFEQAMLKHKSKFILVAVLGVVGSLGYWSYKLYTDATNKSAAVDFLRANSADELRKVASSHAGKPAGGSALVQAAQASADKPSEAAALLKEFLDKYPDHPLRNVAAFRRAEFLSAAGEKDAAVKEYQALASGDSAEAGFAILRLGDIEWAAGNIDKAKEHFTRLTTSAPFAGNPARDKAQQRLKEEIQFKAPDLVEYVEEAPPAPISPPQVPPVNDGLLPPPVLNSPAFTPAVTPGNTPAPTPAPAINTPASGAGETKPADAPKSAESAPAEGTPAGDAPPATPAPEKPAADDKKVSETSKPKLDGEKKPANSSATPKQK